MVGDRPVAIKWEFNTNLPDDLNFEFAASREVSGYSVKGGH
jgi:hypothetical protein